MKVNNPISIKPSQKQRQTYRLVLVTGISAAFLSILLVIYFQFFRNDITKAAKITTLSQENLPVELNVAETVLSAPDTNVREGLKYKIAKPLPQ